MQYLSLEVLIYVLRLKRETTEENDSLALEERTSELVKERSRRKEPIVLSQGRLRKELYTR